MNTKEKPNGLHIGFGLQWFKISTGKRDSELKVVAQYHRKAFHGSPLWDGAVGSSSGS